MRDVKVRSAEHDLRWIAVRPRRLRASPSTVDHALARGRYQSPLRYPGAKSGLSRTISSLVEQTVADRRIPPVDLFVEPFAGGASTSLRLVGSGAVKRVLLADADPLVAAFWQEAAAEPGRLVARMREEHAQYLSGRPEDALSRWDYWRAWQPTGRQERMSVRHELAMKCLFLNRTTFSGILHGRAGPIGGRKQQSDYPIGCRYNPDGLAERIEYVGHLYEAGRIADVWCLDWRATLDEVCSAYKTLIPDRVLAYVDPPYLSKSLRLYATTFSGRPADPVPGAELRFPASEHEQLAGYLNGQIRCRWVLSYDHDDVLLSSCLLYGRDRMTPSEADRLDGVRTWRISKRLVSLNYSASAGAGRGLFDELLLTTLPPEGVPSTGRFRLLS